MSFYSYFWNGQTDQDLQQQSGKQQPDAANPLRNDIYDNAEIELPPPPSPKKKICDFANGQTKNSNQQSTGLTADKKDITSSLQGVSKKKWLWLAGIAGGLFAIGRMTKS
jgi:hypothetical protein